MRVKDNTLIFYDIHRFERNEGRGISFPPYPFSSSFPQKRFNPFPQEAARFPSLLYFVLLSLSLSHTHKSPLIVEDIFFANMFLRHLCLVTSQLSSSLLGLKSRPTSSQLEITLLLFLSRYYKPSLSFTPVLVNEREREDETSCSILFC